MFIIMGMKGSMYMSKKNKNKRNFLIAVGAIAGAAAVAKAASNNLKKKNSKMISNRVN